MPLYNLFAIITVIYMLTGFRHLIAWLIAKIHCFGELILIFKARQGKNTGLTIYFPQNFQD